MRHRLATAAMAGALAATPAGTYLEHGVGWALVVLGVLLLLLALLLGWS